MSNGAHNKANQRQHRRNEGYYKNQHFKTAKNKIRKIKKAVRTNPNDTAQAERLGHWERVYVKPL